MIPEEIKAVKGDKILPKFNKLVAWIDSQRLISVDDRVTTNTTPNGTYVSMVEGPASILTPLRVIQSGDKLYGVKEGYINNKLPFAFLSPSSNEPIINEDGIPLFLKIPKERPLFVVAVAEFDENLVFIKSFLTQLHGSEPDILPRPLEARYDPKLKIILGFMPLAFMRSDRFIQFVTHNLQARAYKHNGSYRVAFWPS